MVVLQILGVCSARSSGMADMRYGRWPGAGGGAAGCDWACGTWGRVAGVSFPFEFAATWNYLYDTS